MIVNFPLLLVPIGFMLFCSYMASQPMRQFKHASASRDWPATTGELEVVSLWGTRNINGRMVEAERLTVSYKFDVDGQRYLGNQVSFYQLHYPETIDFAKAHPQNSRIKVHYNPRKPNEAVLIAGPHPTKPYGPLILASLGLTVSSAIAVAVWLGVLK